MYCTIVLYCIVLYFCTKLTVNVLYFYIEELCACDLMALVGLDKFGHTRINCVISVCYIFSRGHPQGWRQAQF